MNENKTISNLSTTCTVCESVIDGNYCSQCGQMVKGKKTTLSTIIGDIFSNTFSLEKSMFAQVYRIIKMPSKIVHNYMDGYRNYYPNPGRVFLYALTIAALHVLFFESQVLGLTFDITVEDKGIAPQLVFWSLLMPLLTLSSYFTFVRNKFSLAHVSVSTIYISSAFFIAFTIITDLLELAFNLSFNAWAFFAFILLFFIWNATVFTPSKRKTMIAVNTLIQILLFLIAVGSLSAMIWYIYPETLQLND